MSRRPLRAAAVDRRVLAEQLGRSIGAWLPRSQQLVLGWLMVCRPAEQTQAELRAALGLSLGSVSAALRLLEDTGLVERLPPSADRAARYVFVEGGWLRALELSLEAMGSTPALARDAAALLAEEGDARAQRNLEDLADYVERILAAIAAVL
jgi:DNA-binding MarR family transcriptional regulator